MDQLALIIGLLLATVVAVGLGDRLRLPYPVLMLILAASLTFIPGFPEMDIAPELILPIFLPPLLFATAQRSSWAVFRVRWRTLIMLAVALVVVSTAAVAGAAWLMIPGIGIPAAIALGAMVAPPDPVAVESVAGRVHMPRRLITVLQSEGLFNDAAAIVIFQAAVAAAVSGSRIGPDVVLKFLVGAAVAVLVGIAMGWITALITRLVASMVARSAVTLVVPFAAYILAEEVHASGVIAVVVTALEMQRHSRPQDAAERVTRTAFWDVVELLVTGLAFGLVGLEIRHVIHDEGTEILRHDRNRGGGVRHRVRRPVPVAWPAGRLGAQEQQPAAAHLRQGGPDPDLVRHARPRHAGPCAGPAPDLGGRHAVPGAGPAAGHRLRGAAGHPGAARPDAPVADEGPQGHR